MYSPMNARKMLGTAVATDLPSNDSLWVRTYKSLELKTYGDGKSSYIQIISKISTLTEIAEILLIHKDLKSILDTACSGYMPHHEYDSLGSTVTKLPSDYARLTHVMPSPESAGVHDEVYTRLHVVDVLLADGWEPLGCAAHQSVTVGGTTLVETWIKRERHLKK